MRSPAAKTSDGLPDLRAVDKQWFEASRARSVEVATAATEDFGGFL